MFEVGTWHTPEPIVYGASPAAMALSDLVKYTRAITESFDGKILSAMTDTFIYGTSAINITATEVLARQRGEYKAQWLGIDKAVRP